MVEDERSDEKRKRRKNSSEFDKRAEPKSEVRTVYGQMRKNKPRIL